MQQNQINLTRIHITKTFYLYVFINNCI